MYYFKKSSSKLALLLLLFSVNSCYEISESDLDDTSDVELLQKHWIHSYEESVDENGYLHPVNGTYRPSDYNLPPFPLFIMQYKFYEDGNAEYYFLAPNDGHYFKSAKWDFDKENRIITLTYHSTEAPDVQDFFIKELSKDKLVLELIEK